MKRSLIMVLGFAAALASPAFAAEVHHHHVYRHVHRTTGPVEMVPNATALVPAPVSPQSWFTHIAPYPPGQGDTDGLSRDINDCNKGCIGGNPG